jgi:hypothetical protein
MKNQQMQQLLIQFINYEIATHHVTRHNTPTHNILSTAPQKALGTFHEDDNVMPKHVGATIHN